MINGHPNIADEMKGKIWVEGRNGEGATIIVKFPTLSAR